MPSCKQCRDIPSYPFTATLQTDTSTDGDPTESFSATVKSMPVNVTPIRGQETFRGRQLESRVDYVVVTPYRADVDPRQRLLMTGGVYADKTLNIEYTHPIHIAGMMPTLEIYCTELL